MRVTVIGAGAIGGLYGGVLARAGHEVSFLARGEHLRAIQSNGLKIQSPTFGTFVVRGRASDDPSDLGEADLVLFTVKTYDLPEAALAARQTLTADGCLVTFQNGLDAPDLAAAVVGEDRVLIGTTGIESTVLEPGVIGHLSDWHFVTVSSLDGPPTVRVEQIAELLGSAGINVSVVDDGRKALWEKALPLIPMATITSVCRAPLGPIRDLPETRHLTETLLDEVAAVGAAYGFDLADALERARGILRTAPAQMKASMARDFEKGGRTELEALTGALVRLAEARGIDVPANAACYAVLKLRQQLESRRAGAENVLGIGAGGR
jgi:2-dehydropantoate 2-reductase